MTLYSGTYRITDNMEIMDAQTMGELKTPLAPFNRILAKAASWLQRNCIFCERSRTL
jgi:hypothetical protein